MPRDDPAQLQHGEEVGAEGDLQRKPNRSAVIAPHGDRLPQRPRPVGAPLDPEAEPLGGEELAALEAEVGVGELVHRYGARGVGRREQPRQLAAAAGARARLEAAILEPEAKRMLDVGREPAITEGDHEDVPVLDHDAFRKVRQRSEWTAHCGQAMRVAMLAPPWIAVPPPGYGGIEQVIALLPMS